MGGKEDPLGIVQDNLFDHIIKSFMWKPEPVRENESHNIFRNFEIKTDLLMSFRRPDLVLFNKEKRTCHLINFALSADHRKKIKKKERKNIQILRPYQRKNCGN